MEKREKIILVVMAIVVAYGAYYFFIEAPAAKKAAGGGKTTMVSSPRDGGTTDADALTGTADTKAAAAAIRAELAACVLPEVQGRIMTQTAEDWPTNPFFKGKLPSEKAAEKAAAAEAAKAQASQARDAAAAADKRKAEIVSWEQKIRGQFTYTGFARVGDVCLAVINGIEYKEGEEPPPGGCTIERIDPAWVVLRRKGGDNTVTLRIAE